MTQRTDPHIVLLTRYSVRKPGFEERAGIDSEEKRFLWLKQRERLFQAISLPSILRQSRRPDRWFLMMDSVDQWVADAIIPSSEPWIEPVFASGVGHMAIIKKALSPRHPVTLLSRMDSDDAVSGDYFARVSETAVGLEHGSFVLAPRGARWNGQRGHQMTFKNGPFITSVNTGQELVNPMGFNHTTVLQFPHRFIEGMEPLWLQVVHGGNISNALKGDDAGTPLTAENVEVRFGVTGAALLEPQGG